MGSGFLWCTTIYTMDTAEFKQLKKLLGITKRVSSDLAYYQVELTEHEASLQEMIEQGKSRGEIKQQENVLSETLNIIPGTTARLNNAKIDLQTYIQDEEVIAILGVDLPEYQEAVALVQDV
eukprot:TRINITY_DN2396_c0_g1_i2.p1 TRINITY_DN2396_c0_g1~~TRINITY_DN2396_c0_g1_i2.p1  ORF type:complete len:122 (-),score=32.94 TRINITY_DN2396_c0_g1_i2:162-527(-)